MLMMAAEAQTLKVTTDNGTYQFPATGMTESSPAIFTGGAILTIADDAFNITDVTSISVVSNSSSSVENNTVNIVYDGSTATVTMADNVAPYVSATINGAHVTITQSNTSDVDGKEITYQLSGTSTDGSLTLDGSYKCAISLAGVTLTNPSGPAINISNKKRIELSAKNGTENVLTDGADGNESWKGCIYSKGQLQLQGKGSLTVNGNTKHAIKSGDYITVKNLTLNVRSTVGDGISCNKYFVMNSGTVTITSSGDDGIQCDIEEDDTVTGETTDHEDENSGNVYILGGTINASVKGSSAKGIKSAGNMTISGGEITASSTNNEAIESEGSLTISGGYVYAYANDDAINSAGDFTITGGYVMANSSGNDGLDANGNLYIKGGNVFAVATSQPEVGIDANTEGGKKLYITGGNIVTIGGFESGASISGGTAKSASYNKGTWYGLYNGNTLAFAFKVPSNNRMGSSMAVYTTDTPVLMSGVTGDGTSFWNGYGYTSASGGTSVTLSTYNSGGGPGGGGPGGGGPGGGRW
jgi:hypothetical protein